MPASGYVGPLTRAELNKRGSTPDPTAKEEVSLESFIELLIALEIIPSEKAMQARTVLTTEA